MKKIIALAALCISSSVFAAAPFPIPNAQVTGGTIDGTPIGTNVAASGKFTTLNSSNVAITGGTVTGLASPIPLGSGGTGATTATGATSQLQYNQGGTGAVSRSLTSKFQDYVVAQDFGVKCDNSTNNTTALSAALAAAQSAQKPLYIVGNGICKTDWINYGAQPLANQVSIYSDGATLQKISSDGNPVMTIGAANATSYTGPIVIRGLNFFGIPGNSSASLVTYDLVRSSFENSSFQGSIVGYYSYGGISNTAYNSLFANNQIGYRGDTFSSLAGGGVPNLLAFVGSKFVNNSTWGIYYNGGNELLVKDFDIEGNGTTGTSASGGAYCSAVSTGTGCTFDSGWFEQNAGGQNLWLNGGNNDVRSSMFIASPNATNDINITAGRYSLKNVVCVNPKTININETGSLAGNTIDDTFCANLNWNSANTKLFTPGFNSINGNTTIVGTLGASGGINSTSIGATTPSTGAFTTLTASGTGAMPLYNTTGTGVNAPHTVTGSVTLSSGSATATLSGSAVFTSSSSYTCTANDTTAANTVKIGQTSGTSITFTGTGSDIVQFACAGN